MAAPSDDTCHRWYTVGHASTQPRFQRRRPHRRAGVCGRLHGTVGDMIRALAVVAAVLIASGCGAAGTCNASNCSGCCTDRGTCVAGTSATECGGGGEACSSCSAKSECAEKACRVKCVCAEGCCGADGGCIIKQDRAEPFSSSFCPNNGNTYCAPCQAPKTCQPYGMTATAAIYLCQ